MCLSVGMSVRLSVCLSAGRSSYLSACHPLSPSVCLPSVHQPDLCVLFFAGCWFGVHRGVAEIPGLTGTSCSNLTQGPSISPGTWTGNFQESVRNPALIKTGTRTSFTRARTTFSVGLRTGEISHYTIQFIPAQPCSLVRVPFLCEQYQKYLVV